MKRQAVPLWLLVVLIPGLLLAGNNPGAKVAVHVLPHDPHRTCSSGSPGPVLCLDINTTYEGCGDMDVFPVFFDLSEYLGIEYGLEWPGSESCVFTPCSDLHIGGIVRPGDGISQVWFGCKPGPSAIAGWGWIHTTDPGLVTVVPHPYTGEVQVLDCFEAVDQPTYSASAGVCGAEGDDPCLGAGGGVCALRVYDSVGAECILAGHYLTYTIRYENTSNIKVIHDAVLKNTLPEEVKFISATGGGRYSSSAHKVTWNLGDVPPLRKDSVEVTTRILIETLPDIEIVDMCLAFEEDIAIAVSAETTSVCPDLFEPMDLVKDDGMGGLGIAAGDTIVYTMTYGNTANTAAMHNVLLMDVLSPKVVFKTASNGGIYSPGGHKVTWDLGTVEPGEEGAVDIVVETSYELNQRIVIPNTCEIVSDEIRPVQAEVETHVTKIWERYGGLHVMPYKRDRSCSDMASGLETCTDIKTEIAGCGFVHVFPVFVDIPECKSITYRLIWPEDWSDMAFTSCSDITVGDIVRPWDEISHSWTACKSGALVVTGWGEVFADSPGQVEMPYESNGYTLITTCAGRTLTTSLHFACGVCGAHGDYPPCGGPTNIRPTSWGGIKAMFR
jgi:uncharacterized repeat protein (TIGR01451 family)